MFKNLTFPNNHILTLIRIQFQFCIAEPTLNRRQNNIKLAVPEGHIEYKEIKNGFICVEMVVYSGFFQLACQRRKDKDQELTPF